MSLATKRVLLNSLINSPFLPGPACLILKRHSSLSAIHRGLRRSEKARPQGFKSAQDTNPFAALEAASTPSTFSERRRARLAAKPTFRIRRGKKDITEVPKELRSQTRSSRFNDPEKGFGKKSFVYQLKHGDLGAELKVLQEQKKDTEITPRPRRTVLPERPLRTDTVSRWREAREARDYRERRDGRENREVREARDERDGRERREEPRHFRTSEQSSDRRPRQQEDPISIPYTTAASQFLYGTSTVEAAIKAGRRKLYNLYIYSGSNRQKVTQDRLIEKLAERAGVRTVRVEEHGLRMMDKMSGGRPHNGYILETSPLPQSPLNGLGPISTDENKPGYSIILGHQSHEEAQVNGAANFIKTSSKTHKPLVLVLDQVLDPGNLGALLRTASFLGVSAVAISKKNSASLTPVALKASAGASETLTLFSIDSPAGFLIESRKAGWQVYAAVPASSRSKRRTQVDTLEVEESDPLSKDPCILLVGSEGEGLSKILRDKADVEVNIPNNSGSTLIDSLNVSVATGLLCSSFLRGQEKARVVRAKEENAIF